MVSILPSERTALDVIGKNLGQAFQQNLPGAVQQGYQRGQGLSAIDQLQESLKASGGDINKILPALAKAYTLNPNLERSGLGQQYMQNARVANAFPEQNQKQIPQNQQRLAAPNQLASQSARAGTEDAQENETLQQPVQNKSTFATPSPFNVFTVKDIDAESQRYAQALNDPNAYTTRFNQLTAQNEAATNQRNELENAAIKAGVNAAELPRFMVVNADLDPRNPSEWAQKAIRNYADIKNNDDALERAFIPGLGNALIGQNRDEALKNLQGPVQRNASRGLEQEDRKFLADNYLTPTEIESLYHPLTTKHEKSLEKIPKGLFPAKKKGTWGEVADIYRGKMEKNPFVSYEEARERDPQALQVMQNNLSDFFSKNVDKNTSLLGLREKLWGEKDYDWRQIGPAIRQAEKNGLKLEPFQEREMATIETQPPIQSLPDIFKGLDRLTSFLRGNK